MAQPGQAPVVKLICGVISSRVALLEETALAASKVFGPIELTSETMAFDFTHYYDEQMGSPLYRCFVAFEPAVAADVLVEAKLATNDIEREFVSRCAGPGQPPRPVNLDPGYVESSKLVLASMKNFSHRIYLGRGVYGDLTLIYHKGRWEALNWTCPDYASGRYWPFLDEARAKLRRQLEGTE